MHPTSHSYETRTEIQDVAVVGGSFAGLAAALQLGRARRAVTVVDAGKPRNRFSHAAHGFPGQDGRPPLAILQDLRDEVLAYPTVRLLEDEVVDARAAGAGVYEVDLATGAVLRARRLILATGVTDTLPAVPGLLERWGRTVLHCPYCHGYEVADRRLGILAVSSMSMHQALLLPDWSGDVTLFTNGSFTPDEEQRAALAARAVLLETRRVDALLGEAPALSGLRLEGGEIVPVDALFTAPTAIMANSLAERLGCALDETPMGVLVRTDAVKETTVPGVFCAGDAARQPHNVTLAAADGVMAGIAAHRSIVFAPPAPAAAAK
jgi:thioredoxin reductase